MIYCKKCLHFMIDPVYVNRSTCKVSTRIKSTFYREEIEFVFCSSVNENNDCLLFEPKIDILFKIRNFFNKMI